MIHTDVQCIVGTIEPKRRRPSHARKRKFQNATRKYKAINTTVNEFLRISLYNIKHQEDVLTICDVLTVVASQL